jgi:predicted nucleotidyltransferase component of viral defense system
MAQEARLNAWETLLGYALRAIDSVGRPAFATENWSLGGGTVLMRRYRHRLSRDIDIFVPDPQYLGHLDPALNDAVEALAPKHLKGAGFLRLYFPEGEVDFVAAAPVTVKPTTLETVLGRRMRLDTSIEIVAKKIRYRGAQFTARDLFDFAQVAKAHPRDMAKLRPVLHELRDRLHERLSLDDKVLRETFAALDVLEFRPTYEECAGVLRRQLEKA